MKRWVYFLLCLIFGGALLLASWRIPSYLRAVDSRVLLRAGQKTPGLIERGLALVRDKNIGAAEMLLQVAQQEKISDSEKLRVAIAHASQAHPDWQFLGTDPRTLVELFPDSAEGQTRRTKNNSTAQTAISVRQSHPFTELIIQAGNREKALTTLRKSALPPVQELLKCRVLTNTVLFPPAKSSSGQAFDAALSACGLLLEKKYLTDGLSNEILFTSSAAVRGKSSQPLEQILLDLMSLGQRMNWGQLVAFCKHIEDAETLRLQANLARKADVKLPVLFSAVELSGKPAAVAKYMMTFGETGQKDLAASFPFHVGGVNELLQRNQRLHQSNFRGKLNGLPAAFVHLSWQTPRLALTLKWIFYFLAGYLFALALHFVRPRTPLNERPFHGRSFHAVREILFALGFLLVVLLLSEPFLAQDNQNLKIPIRLHLPTVGNAVTAEKTGDHHSIMNQLSLLTLLLFFVLQALLYVASLVKLAEIRRQMFPTHTKLKLLENEEHLFDAGLYLGFAGTIISLILVSMGVIKPSLMAAYSSTSFGVIFVSVFKIFHLRPLRRKLLIETESAKTVTVAPAANPYSTPL